MSESQPRRGSRVPLAFGLIFVASGLWVFLDAQGVNVPSFAKFWPILFLLAGAAALADLFFLSKRPGSAGWAVTDVGFGVLGLALTHGYTTWAKILDWLPSFPTILGLSLLVTWLVGGRRNDNQMIAGGVLLVLGLMGFAARFEWLQRILPSAQVLWAVLLIAGGGLLVWRALKSKG
jgi:LiaF transmembrane domain